MDGSMEIGTIKRAEKAVGRAKVGGVAGWLLALLRREARSRPSLALLERISLAPRQSLALVEAEGRRFLVATSADGAPAFYALDDRARAGISPRVKGRVSW